MSVFGGRRSSSPAPDRARSDAAALAPGAGDSLARHPHFRPAPAPLPIADGESLEDARRILDDLRVHIAELDRREQSLNGQLTLLDREQRALRLNAQQFAADCHDLQQAQDEREQRLAAREAAAAALVTQAEQRQRALDSQQAEIDRQRARLKDDVAVEFADQQRQLTAQQDALDVRLAEVDQQRAQLREELLAEVADERRQLAGLEELLEARQADVDRERAEFRDTVMAELADERRQLETAQHELAQAQTELADAIARRQAALEQEIAEHTALLAQLRAERLADVEIREAEVGQREVDLIKRTRFQEEHLSRLRSNIEAKQADLERSRAAVSVWNADVDATVRGRLSHLRKFRDLLERRESACHAAWEELAAARQQQQAVLDELRQHAVAEQRAQAEQQQAIAGDLRRHADLLRLREQEQERRSARFDQLRDELERRHHDLLARETAVQAAAAWLTDRIGVEAADLLVPRDDAPILRDPAIDDQRREIAEAERQLAQWQHELHREREAFAQLIVDREQRLRSREASLGRQLEQLAAREASLHAAQLRDRDEREQSYAVLESLVSQIERRLGR